MDRLLISNMVCLRRLVYDQTKRKMSSSIQSNKAINFVPESKPVNQDDIIKLEEFLSYSNRLFVLTGAGLSTESGIPDYRSEGVGLYARSNHRPMNYQDFIKSSERRKNYWARNYAGWARYSSFQPNSSHLTLHEWERRGLIQCLVTQNVDSLHIKAGSTSTVELHGSLHRVTCLQCTETISRFTLQETFREINPSFNVGSVMIAPDGDVMLTQEQVKDFNVPPCASCGGVLKPDITFFGANVDREKVDYIYSQVDSSDSVLVAGSSLMVFSGYRFVNRAAEQGKPIAIINIGSTRADKLADLKIEARCGAILPLVRV